MKKLWMGAAILFGGLMMTPGVMAVEVSQRELGTAQNITASDTINSGEVGVTITGNDPEGLNRSTIVTVAYNSADLKYVAAGADGQRPEGYAWLGTRIIGPTLGGDGGLQTCENVKLYIDGDEREFTWDAEKPACVLNLYTGVDINDLKEAATRGDRTLQLAEYTFDWYGADGVGDQTFRIVVNVEGITLTNDKGETFTPEDAKELIAAAEANNSSTDGSTTSGEPLDNPDTADQIVAYLSIGGVAVLGLAALTVMVIKNNKKTTKRQKR